MNNYINIMSTTPWDELCAQAGDERYRVNAKVEAAVYIDQINRRIGPNPAGTYFRSVWNEHDAGQYLDIQFHYDDEDPNHVIYLDEVARGLEKWDEEARLALHRNGYALPLPKVVPIMRQQLVERKEWGT